MIFITNSLKKEILTNTIKILSLDQMHNNIEVLIWKIKNGRVGISDHLHMWILSLSYTGRDSTVYVHWMHMVRKWKRNFYCGGITSYYIKNQSLDSIYLKNISEN